MITAAELACFLAEYSCTPLPEVFNRCYWRCYSACLADATRLHELFVDALHNECERLSEILQTVPTSGQGELSWLRGREFALQRSRREIYLLCKVGSVLFANAPSRQQADRQHIVFEDLDDIYINSFPPLGTTFWRRVGSVLRNPQLARRVPIRSLRGLVLVWFRLGPPVQPARGDAQHVALRPIHTRRCIREALCLHLAALAHFDDAARDRARRARRSVNVYEIVRSTDLPGYILAFLSLSDILAVYCVRCTGLR